MNREETLKLFNQGKGAWNPWANEMLTEKQRLKNAGSWEQSKPYWQNRASADFSNFTFKEETDFRDCIFPGKANFNDVIFNKLVSFSDTVFHEDVSFKKVIFQASSGFVETTFHKYAGFKEAEFHGIASFFKVKFYGITPFFNINFYKRTDFISSSFFDVSFSKVKFHEGAGFKAINSERSFILDETIFEQVPDFEQAHFLEAPSFDNVTIKAKADIDLSPSRGGIKGGGKPQKEKTITSRWRHLRRLATQGHDHESAANFFAEEIKSRRNVEDFATGKNWQRYWGGKIYQALSNFGRSIVRPFAWWFAAFIVYAASLIIGHGLTVSSRGLNASYNCIYGDANLYGTAFKTALDNALLLPIFGVSDGQVQENYAYLVII